MTIKTLGEIFDDIVGSKLNEINGSCELSRACNFALIFRLLRRRLPFFALKANESDLRCSVPHFFPIMKITASSKTESCHTDQIQISAER